MNINKLIKFTKNCRRLNVLVVEDNPDMARVISGILKVKGCNTTCVSTCDDAYALIQEDRPDIVSCDIRLSGEKTGLDLARLVRSDHQLVNLFLIAISAFDSKEEKAAALSAGFDMFFSKPVKFSDLTEAIEAYSKQF
ncbi:MAG: response regulator [Burkholderiaceae bacterium]